MITGCCGAKQTLSGEFIRVATFNASLSRSNIGQLCHELAEGNKQAQAIACIIQTIRPDILLLNEFDYDSQLQSIRLFMDNYLAVPQNGQKPIRYPFHYIASVNTGIPSGRDLDHDGNTDGPGDAYGYGRFAGQYGMAFFSMYPIHIEQVRTFQHFLWKDMPTSLLPPGWYDDQTLNIFRLSSKSHWDIPVDCQGVVIHCLCSHPTPPVFDGPEDRNGRRNHDEIRFWLDYITEGNSEYIYDDKGNKGGLQANQPFILLGDMNADPHDGDSANAAINQLLYCTDIQDTQPSSTGAIEASAARPHFNASHTGRSCLDTYQSPSNESPGNLRLDYVLPSGGLKVIHSGVFWPSQTDRNRQLADVSDHHMVYVDIQM